MASVELVNEAAGEWNHRFGVRLRDGALVEAVLYRGDTLCVSCQVGCAVACPFCASGSGGLGRNLALEEIVGQVEAVTAARGHSIARVTVSGVGEPLHNFAVVAAFVAWAKGHGMGTSVTTSGGPLARLREALALDHKGLTVSVHAGSERARARLVPKGPALGGLFDTLAAALPTMSERKRRKTALAYLVIAGENDGDDEIDAFVARARPLGLPVHLYAYNPVSTSNARPVGRERYEAIYAAMRAAGLVVRMSSRARVESNGGCGTLIARLVRAGDLNDGARRATDGRHRSNPTPVANVDETRRVFPMIFELPPLPYSKEALAPHMSAETLEFHYGKHHKAYLDKLKTLLDGKPEANKSLEEIVLSSEGAVFNNAAQVWNHTFFWNSMKPQGGGQPSGELAQAITRDFGSFEKFKEEFVNAAVARFGSGWAWLVNEGGKPKIVTTANADVPMKQGQKPLMTCDVWEHAYYIDYRNARQKFVETFLASLVNWDFAAQNMHLVVE